MDCHNSSLADDRLFFSAFVSSDVSGGNSSGDVGNEEHFLYECCNQQTTNNATSSIPTQFRFDKIQLN